MESVKQEILLNQNISMSPIKVEFELTEKCNLVCKFCYNSQQPVVCSNPYEIIKQLEDENVLEIVLTGGEPLLHPDFMKIAEKCSCVFSSVLLQTNGTLMTKELVNELENIGVSSINISLHGPGDVNDYLTGVSGSYRQALKAIEYVLNTDINFATNFVLTSKNIGEFPAHVEFMRDLGVKMFTLTRFTPTGSGSCNKNLEPSRDELISVLKYVDEAQKQYNGLSFLLANSIPKCALPEGLESFCSYCHFGSSRFYIDVHGNLLMCGMSRIQLGNILENTIMDIKKQSKIYHDYILGRSFPQQCKTCVDFVNCRGGCRAAALAATGSFDGKDPLVSKRVYSERKR